MINSLKYIIQKAVEMEASDLHIVVGAPPVVRVNGEIILMNYDKLEPNETRDLILSLLNEIQVKQLTETRHLCFSQTIDNLGYFRITGSQFQMQSMDKSIKDIYQKGLISYDIAYSHLKDVRTLHRQQPPSSSDDE